MLLDANILGRKFNEGLPHADFVVEAEAQGYRGPWDQRYQQLALDEEAQTLVRSFNRRLNMLCLTGMWCGDCALQGSAMARIAEASPLIELRFLPRNETHAELIVKAQINGGFRVPVTWFLAEDFEPVAVFGDRTLSRYRAMARKQLPPQHTNVLAPPPADPVGEVLREVLEMVERVELLLTLSPRLSQKHTQEVH